MIFSCTKMGLELVSKDHVCEVGLLIKRQWSVNGWNTKVSLRVTGMRVLTSLMTWLSESFSPGIYTDTSEKPLPIQSWTILLVSIAILGSLKTNLDWENVYICHVNPTIDWYRSKSHSVCLFGVRTVSLPLKLHGPPCNFIGPLPQILEFLYDYSK